jgi:glycolate oxidase
VHFLDDLQKLIEGEVYDEPWIKNYYSVDASHHQLFPEVICFPKNKHDIIESIDFSKTNNLSVTSRGAGTGLLGQCLSNGLIFDFTKFMNKTIDIDTQSNIVQVQPGIIKGELDKTLKKHGKLLPPDPASSNYCTIGGMVSNNSSGAHSLGFGSIYKYIHSIEFIYADSQEGFARDNHCDARMRKILSGIAPYYKDIVSFYPDVTKNSCGYRIDAVFKDCFKPQNIFAASEGTLGIISSVTFSLVDLPIFRSLFLIYFPSILISLKYVKKLLSTLPVAIELLDSSVMDNAIRHRINHNDGCLVFVEFFYDFKNHIDHTRNLLLSKISDDGLIVEEAHDDVSINRLWSSRRNALNMAIKNTLGDRKPMGIIEDVAVSPDNLYEYINFLLKLYSEYNLSFVIYGHMGDGNLHTRPIIDHSSTVSFDSHQELLNKTFAKVVFDKVLQFRGTITGEHGDGITRSPYIEKMYGPYAYSFFKYLKKSFDPTYMLNPGKKVMIP